MNLADRLRSALAGQASAELLPGDLIEAIPEGTPAAVLVAITERSAPGVLLTVRREHLRTHAGQVAFPGGRIDDGEDAVAAALREANEEIGLDPGRVAVIGHADPYCTVTNYCVTPIIGLVPPDLPLEANCAEVAEWFEAPLDFLIDPGNQQRRSALFRGRERHYYEIEWEGRRIWGATAAMIVNLSRRLAT